MSNYLLSIITVTRNCAGTIDRTLATVQAIKQVGIEYIVVDGASTDGTADIVRRRGALVDRLVSEPDSGIYNAMNKGVALAKGRYILFINGDDELVAEGFPAAMSAMREGGADIVCAATQVCDEAGILVSTMKARPWQLLLAESGEGSPIPHPSSFIKAELLTRFPYREDFRIASDYDFFLRAFIARCSFTEVPVTTALFRLGGVSGNYQLALEEVDRSRRERLGWYFHVRRFARTASEHFRDLSNFTKRIYAGIKRRLP